MPDIVLTTLNAKFIHSAFGLRYLFANLGELQPRAVIVEFDINQRPLEIAESLFARLERPAPSRPDATRDGEHAGSEAGVPPTQIIGFGVYIWNVTQTTEVISIIKRVRPETTIILGGPEVSYESEGQPIVELADHVITGEADLKFAEVCRELLASGVVPGIQPGGKGVDRQAWVGEEDDSAMLDGNPVGRMTPATAGKMRAATLPKIIPAELPDFSCIVLPYDFYTAADLAHRVVYVEASRGCPFTCEFCLSSLDIPVRQAPLDKFLAAMQALIHRGLKQFKFVDRTFNLHIATSRALLEFFLARCQPGMFFHFEMIPDRLPAELREVIAKFPPGSLQFEVGIQTFNPEVGTLISRRQNYERLTDNFNYLRNETSVHIHADLIVGLPGETLESFAAGFDRLIALGPQEIQVGILKRLRGTPIMRHDQAWQMVYSALPPYEILQNKLLDFALMQRLRRFAKYWDLIGNSGNFVETVPLLWRDGSPFVNFFRLSDWLYAKLRRTDSIALVRLAESLFEFLTSELEFAAPLAAAKLWLDWQRGGHRDPPEKIRPHLPLETTFRPRVIQPISPKRQARHLAAP